MCKSSELVSLRLKTIIQSDERYALIVLKTTAIITLKFNKQTKTNKQNKKG